MTATWEKWKSMKRYILCSCMPCGFRSNLINTFSINTPLGLHYNSRLTADTVVHRHRRCVPIISLQADNTTWFRRAIIWGSGAKTASALWCVRVLTTATAVLLILLILCFQRSQPTDSHFTARKKYTRVCVCVNECLLVSCSHYKRE